MRIISLTEPDLYQLMQEVVAHFISLDIVGKEKWISPEEAMKLLNIKSKTTLSALRSSGKIRYAHPQKRIILYDRESINEYLENNARDTF